MFLGFENISENDLKELCKKYNLNISFEESKKIVKMLKRNPTLTEATIWSIQGSEHSSYKSSKKFLKQLPTSATPVILGPKEDAGIVEFCVINNEKYGIVYSHESHNAPSQLVPYEGAATGVGGICRDIACMGAKVIGVLDSLRFGDENLLKNKVIARGVVEGVAGYANPLGVPNLGGDSFFNKSFDGFTLVNVVALGLVKEKNILHSFVPSDAADKTYELIVVGKGTDKSGFGGASFSSQIVDEKEVKKNLGAVQEPNPFLERHLLASFQDLFKILEEKGELQSIALKDMGAGGILCASIELAEGAENHNFGVEVDVEKIHLSIDEKEIESHVILCSETQERFCFAVPPHLTNLVLDHFNKKWDFPNVSPYSKASKIGKITNTGKYIAKYKGEVICDANVRDITEGLQIDRPYILPKDLSKNDEIQKPESLSAFLYEFLSRPNLASKLCITEQYDQTVQGNTILDRNETDAVILAPLQDEEGLNDLEKKHGIAISVSGSCHLGAISPYLQGAYAVLTSIQKVISAGAIPKSLTDCLNYGNPEIPEDMGKFVAGMNGITDAAKNIRLFDFPTEPTPFISGNVSLYKKGNPSAIVSCLGTINNIDKGIKNIVKNKSIAILIGDRPNEIGGTEFSQTQKGNFIPAKIDFAQAEKLSFTMIKAIKHGYIDSSSVINEGGLVTTLLHACIKSKLGFKGNLESFDIGQLFSEGNGFLVSVLPKYQQKLIEFLKQEKINYSVLGVYIDHETIDGKIFTLNKSVLKKSWDEGLRNLVF